MRRFDPKEIKHFAPYPNLVDMEENAQSGEYVLWIDANGALNELQRKFDVLHEQYMKLDLENASLQRELDPDSMKGWDE